jgi:hypothetical protein
LRFVIFTIALCCGAALIWGCSLRNASARAMADALTATATSYRSDDDPELVREALPFALKTLEGLLDQVPEHRGVLRALSAGFTGYAVAFVLPGRGDLTRGGPAVDDRAARAQRLLLRGRDYGVRTLELRIPGLGRRLRQDFKGALQSTTREDVPDLYWTAAAWGSAIGAVRGEVLRLAEIPIVDALIRRALELDDTFDYGSLHEFMIVFESRGDSTGGNLDRARTHFTRARELARGRRISPLVTFAENVALQQKNRQEYESLLEEALAFDAQSIREERLLNVIAQQRARELLVAADALFD